MTQREEFDPRYHVKQEGFWWRVKAANGTRTLLKAATKTGAERLAATLEAEFRTGIFVGQQAAQAAQPAVPDLLAALISIRVGMVDAKNTNIVDYIDAVIGGAQPAQPQIVQRRVIVRTIEEHK